MEINSRKGPDFIRPALQKKGSQPPMKPAEAARTQFISSELSSLIEDKLDRLPEIRSDKIKEGLQLAEDSSYPLDVDLDALAQRIAEDEPEEDSGESTAAG